MKLLIVGDSYVLNTSLTVEAINLVKQNKPEALKLFDKDGNETFAISYNAGKGSIAKFGITFGGASRNGDGTATVTGVIPSDVPDAKEYVAELVGCVVANLKTLEETIPVVAAEIAANKSALLASIEMM